MAFIILNNVFIELNVFPLTFKKIKGFDVNVIYYK